MSPQFLRGMGEIVKILRIRKDKYHRYPGYQIEGAEE